MCILEVHQLPDVFMSKDVATPLYPGEMETKRTGQFAGFPEA